MWTVPREWAGETAFVIAGGPSVRNQNVELLRGRKVIAINSSFRLVPWADFLFCGDSRWWREHRTAVLATFKGRIVSTGINIDDACVLRLRRAEASLGLSADPSAVVIGRTSTQAAINLAVLLGAKRVVLLGVDMQPALDGRTHHHDPHPWPQRPGCWKEQMDHLAKMVAPLRKAGVEVINTSLASLVPWWPKRPLEDCLMTTTPHVLLRET